MAGWNGSGVFSRTYSWVQDQLNGIKIRADRHDANDVDFVNGINNCLTKDGQNQPTGNLPMGGFKHTAVDKATALNQYATAEQIIDNELTYYSATGTDTYAITPSPAITTYAAGQSFKVLFTNGNTGAATINVNTLGAKALTKGASTALVSGDLVAGKIYEIVYDGTRYQVKDIAPSLTTLTADLDANGFDILFDNATGIRDDSDNEQLTFSKTASAVNEFTMTNAATGAGPTIAATGSDTNIDINLQTKGTGVINAKGTATASAEVRLFEDTDNGTNYVGIKAAANTTSSFTMTLPAALPAAIANMRIDNTGAVTFANGSGVELQTVESLISTYDSIAAATSAFDYDNNIMQNTEGKEFTTRAITPQSASSVLLIEMFGNFSHSNSNEIVGMGLFVDTTADAIQTQITNQVTNKMQSGYFSVRVPSGSTSARTYKMRYGASTGTAYINGDSGGAKGGGKILSGIRITEIL